MAQDRKFEAALRAKNELIATYETYRRVERIEAEKQELVRRMFKHERDPATAQADR